MKKTKSIIGSILLTAFLIINSSFLTYANTNYTLNRVQLENNQVEISIDSVDSIVTAFQLSLKLEGNIKLDKINWDKNLESKSIIKYKYDKNNNILNIYVTSKENIVNIKGEILIGTLSLIGEDNQKFNIVPNNINAGNTTYKFVTDNYKEISGKDMVVKGDKDFIYNNQNNGDEVTPPDNNESEVLPPDNENNKPLPPNEGDGNESINPPSDGNENDTVLPPSDGGENDTLLPPSDGDENNTVLPPNDENENDTTLPPSNDNSNKLPNTGNIVILPYIGVGLIILGIFLKLRKNRIKVK